MKKIVQKSQINYFQVMDERGKIDKKLMPKISNKNIIKAYEAMVLGRRFDDKMLAMQRQGRIATFAEIKGQEACNIGVAMVLQKGDWMVQAFRENAAALYLGQLMRNILLYYGGDERGSMIPKGVNITPSAVPVASQILHTTGIAWAMKLKKQKNVCVGFFGDGATSEGDFHEALNFAGVFNVPAVFICQNNQFAISVPRSHQTKSETIAQKSVAYGIKGIQVDGNDFFSVYSATKEAFENARSKKGPTLIECITYRLGNHTTSDDALRYRTQKEVNTWKKKDPILRLQSYLKMKKLWTTQYENDLIKRLDKQIESEVLAYENTPLPKTEDIFRYTFAQMTDDLTDQLAYCARFEK